MRKFLFSIAMLLTATGASAQVKVTEPEFVGNYCILTSDSTYETLPKENGTIGKHKNKVRKIAGFIGGAADAVGGLGILGMATAGHSVNGMMNGARTLGGAIGVGQVADAANSLAGAEGMDIVFKGPKSAYQVADASKGVRFIIKAESNETDPMDSYRIVRFKAGKKDRRVQWMEFNSALLGSKDVEERGYLNFIGHKYGEQSYLIEVPASELAAGEYGIFFMSIITATAVPVGTFSVQ